MFKSLESEKISISVSQIKQKERKESFTQMSFTNYIEEMNVH